MQASPNGSPQKHEESVAPMGVPTAAPAQELCRPEPVKRGASTGGTLTLCAPLPPLSMDAGRNASGGADTGELSVLSAASTTMSEPASLASGPVALSVDLHAANKLRAAEEAPVVRTAPTQASQASSKAEQKAELATKRVSPAKRAKEPAAGRADGARAAEGDAQQVGGDTDAAAAKKHTQSWLMRQPTQVAGDPPPPKNKRRKGGQDKGNEAKAAWQPSLAPPQHSHGSVAMKLPPPPPPCLFDGRRCPLPQPSAAAIESLDRAVGAYYRQARAESTALDDPACTLMAHVQGAVGSLWPFGRVACFGSRATGLACATSDIDLVVTGVPGLDPASMQRARWPARRPPTMNDQLTALEDLLPRLTAIPGITSAQINRSAVPVIAITADVATIERCAKQAAAALRDADVDADVDAPPMAKSAPPVSVDGAAAGVPSGVGPVSHSERTPVTSAARASTLHLDISIHTDRHRGLLAAQHVRWLHAHLPPLAPLVVLLKALLHRHALKSAFTGGLSSYALVVMVARFLIDRPLLQYKRWGLERAKSAPDAIATVRASATEIERVVSAAEVTLDLKPSVLAAAATTADGTADAAAAAAGAPEGVESASPPPEARDDASPSLGTLLVEVLGFYGHVFDPSQHALLGGTGMGVIPPAGCGFAERDNLTPLLCMANAFGGYQMPAQDPFALQPLVCVDPVDSTNNMSKACYRIAAVQKLFAEAAAAAVGASEAKAAEVPTKGPARGGQSISAGFIAVIGAESGFSAPPGDAPATSAAWTTREAEAHLALAEIILESASLEGMPPRPASA